MYNDGLSYECPLDEALMVIYEFFKLLKRLNLIKLLVYKLKCIKITKNKVY